MSRRGLQEATLLELKLFIREPVSVVFTLALPMALILVLGGVFGNTPDPEHKVYRNVGPMTFYAPAYIALVMASTGLIGLPAHLAGYRERGVLRRLRASTVPVPAIVGAQVLTAVVAALAGGALVTAVDAAVYHAAMPRQPVAVAAAAVLCAVAFAALGVMLGSLFRTARAAQGWGVLLWFVMMMVSGTGPPPEVLSGGLAVAATLSPLRHAVVAVQDPWLGAGWNVHALLIVAGMAAAAGLVAARLAARR